MAFGRDLGLAVGMRFDKILRTGQQILNSDQGRAATRKVANTAFGAARKAAPKQAANIDRAQRAADGYLGRQDGTGTGGNPTNNPNDPNRF